MGTRTILALTVTLALISAVYCSGRFGGDPYVPLEDAGAASPEAAEAQEHWLAGEREVEPLPPEAPDPEVGREAASEDEPLATAESPGDATSLRVTGTLLAPTGEPVTGTALIHWWWTSEGRRTGTFAKLVLGQGGSFTADVPERFWLSAGTAPTVRFRGSDASCAGFSAELELPLTARGAQNDLGTILLREPTHLVSGVVLDPEGRRVDRAVRLRVRREETADQGLGFGGWSGGSFRSDGDGTFELCLEEPPAGQRFLIQAASDPSAEVAFTLGDRGVELGLLRTVTVTGRIVGLSERALTVLQVRFAPRDPARIPMTYAVFPAADGAFTLEVPVGEYRLEFSQDLAAPPRTSSTLPRSRAFMLRKLHEQLFGLYPAAGSSEVALGDLDLGGLLVESVVRCADPEGQPLSSATLQQSGGASVPVFDAAGELLVLRRIAEPVDLEIAAPGFVVAKAHVDRARVDVVLQRETDVIVQVPLWRNVPEGCSFVVSVKRPDDDLHWAWHRAGTHPVGEDGTVALTLAPGEHLLRLSLVRSVAAGRFEAVLGGTGGVPSEQRIDVPAQLAQPFLVVVEHGASELAQAEEQLRRLEEKAAER